MSQLILAIDPGLSGGIAAITEHGKFVFARPTPTITVKKGNKKRLLYVETEMTSQFMLAVRTHCTLQPDEVDENIIPGLEIISLVGIEDVHAMPGQGVSSMFSMGVGFGLWRGIVAGLGLPIQRTDPGRWKRMFNLSKDKKESIVRANQLFPKCGITKMKDEGCAEALLLAEYFRRQLHGPLEARASAVPKRRAPQGTRVAKPGQNWAQGANTVCK